MLFRLLLASLLVLAPLDAVTGQAPLRDHRAAIDHLLGWLTDADSGVAISSVAEIGAAGHRVAHGGERFIHSVRIDEQVLRDRAAAFSPERFRREISEFLMTLDAEE